MGIEKNDDEFSDEHIWPDALGGDFLPPEVWRTSDVCRQCNSLSGVFVDGSFIRSWMGNAERATGAREYLKQALTAPLGVLPLDYMGRLADDVCGEAETAEFWTGPCGANIVHVRPKDKEELWTPYAGGDPRAKKSRAGRAYMALASQDPFWFFIALSSFKAHFKRAERILVNVEVARGLEKSFTALDRSNPVHDEDMKAMDAIQQAARTGGNVRVQATTKLDLGSRMLAKLALALGYMLFGDAFLLTDYGKHLRRGFREADITKRRQIPIRGSGFLSGGNPSAAGSALAWTGGWVLLIRRSGGDVSLSVVSPSAKMMTVVITPDADVLPAIDSVYEEGLLWITVPSAGAAAGPVPLLAYLAHKAKLAVVPQLATLEGLRNDPSQLPPC
ncbi:HNH endonuclease [Afipia sp. TerB]